MAGSIEDLDDQNAPLSPEAFAAEESQPLRTLSREAPDEAAEDFARTHGLEFALPTFRKAALVLQHEAALHDGTHTLLTESESRALDRESTHRWSQPFALYFTICVCSLGAIEQGWAQTGMNGANLYFPATLGIDSDSAHDSLVLGLINSGIYLAMALVGSWISDPVNRRIGRRGAVFVGSIMCLVGNAGSAIAWNWPIMMTFRLVLGTGLGLNASTVSVYAAECAPAYIRGGLAVSWQMFTAFGIFVGFLANVTFAGLGPNLIWRAQLGIPATPAVPLVLLIYSCPESPAWYVKKSRYDLAFQSLSRLRNTELQAAIELYGSCIADRGGTANTSSKEPSLWRKFTSLFKVPRNRHALYASYTVMLSQQLCGINIISFYSSTIFSSSGFSPLAALWASVIFGLLNFLGAIPAIWSMDTFGRRQLLLYTLPIMALTMGCASLSFMLPEGTFQFVLLAGLIYIFCLLYSPGMGPVPCAYSAEVYPLNVREIGMAFATFTAASWATILSLTFPALLDALGEQGCFGLYAILNLLAWSLCWTFVRETRMVRLEEMDGIFSSSSSEFVKDSWQTRWRMAGGRERGWKKIGQEDLEEEQMFQSS